MDIESIEKRISDIEEILGIDDFSNKKSIPSQIEAIQSKLRDDCKANLLMSVPAAKLEKLNKIATETSGQYGTLADKVESIKFAENLIHQRAERIKVFSEALEPCLDTELFSKVAEMQPELTVEIEKCEKLLEEWTKLYDDFQTLVRERGMINRKITEKVVELQRKIDSKSA